MNLSVFLFFFSFLFMKNYSTFLALGTWHLASFNEIFTIPKKKKREEKDIKSIKKWNDTQIKFPLFRRNGYEYIYCLLSVECFVLWKVDFIFPSFISSTTHFRFETAHWITTMNYDLMLFVLFLLLFLLLFFRKKI